MESNKFFFFAWLYVKFSPFSTGIVAILQLRPLKNMRNKTLAIEVRLVTVIVLLFTWVFPKIGGKHPKWMVYNGKPLLKWMIWGYHYFRKHPHGCEIIPKNGRMKIGFFSPIKSRNRGVSFLIPLKGRVRPCFFFQVSSAAIPGNFIEMYPSQRELGHESIDISACLSFSRDVRTKSAFP